MCQTNSFRNELNFTFRNGVLIESLACVLDLQVSDVIFFFSVQIPHREIFVSN